MNPNRRIRGLRAMLLSMSCLGFLPRAVAADKPNVVIIFTDDQGYNDLGCFGSKRIKTPNIDRLAREGRMFTSFYVASSVCSPSRAALLTGCYPKRVGMHRHVLFPQSKHGLHPDEYTIADHLKANGYATVCVGKWHLGHHPETLPRKQGFDAYYGIPYSNDMNHPDNRGKPRISQDQSWADPTVCIRLWKTPLMENGTIIECPVDQRTITRRYTDRAIAFVQSNRDRPFFLYLAHTMPHIPLFVPEDAYDPDPRNAYTCVIEHIDAEVGRLVQTIRDLGLEQNTYVIFTSDNGPWLQFGHHGGCADPLRAGKGTPFEGGQRVPCVMWGPGRIPAGTTTGAFASTMDLLPAIARLSGTTLPADRRIDGLDISRTILGNGPSPRKELLFYSPGGTLRGIRQEEFKLLILGKGGQGKPEPRLFNLAQDIGESTNIAAQHPEKVAALTARMNELDAEIARNSRPVWREDP